MAVDRFAPIRQEVRRARSVLGITQERLAERAQVADTFVINLEQRRRQLSLPDEWADFSRVAKELRLDPKVLLRSVGVGL